MRGVHGLLHHDEQFLPQLIQVHFLAQLGTEGCQRLGCIILATIEAQVNDRLNASTQGLEEGGNHQGRGDNEDGLIPCLPGHHMTEGLQGKDETKVEQSKQSCQGAIDQRTLDQ